MPSHVLELTPGPSDVDELDHVNNVAYVRWVQDVAKAHSAAVGWDHAAYRALGLVFVVRRHEIDYKAQGFAHQPVRLTTWVHSWSAASSVRRTTVTRAADGVVLAEAATTWAMIELATGRPRRIPAELRAAFGEGPG